MVALNSELENVPAEKRLKILVVHNCQSFGLAKCFNFLISNSKCDSLRPKNLRRVFEKNLEMRTRFPKKYDYYILAEAGLGVLKKAKVNISGMKIIVVPNLEFAAYHPDICYLTLKGDAKAKALRGVMDSYHSNLVFKAFKAGLDEKAITSLFSEEVFAALGYLDCWEAEKTRMLKRFSTFGIDLTGHAEKWSRDEAFMHSWNHPKIKCLFDIVSKIIKIHSIPGRLKLNEHNLPVMDNLTQGPVYPVYPEIAESYGTCGSYTFKLPSGDKNIGIDEFISASLKLYREMEAAGHKIIIKHETGAGKNIKAYLQKYVI